MKNFYSLMLLTALSFCIASCSKDDDEVPSVQTSCELEVGETFDLGFKGEWLTSNPYVATIDQEGIITAQRMGTARVLLNKHNLHCDVTVKPNYTLYNEPVTEWGISKNALIEKRGMPDAADGEMVGYVTNNEALPLEMYTFEEYRLTECMMMGDANYKSQITKHLNQRYKYMTQSEGILIYIDSERADNAKTLIGLACDNGIAMLLYLESQFSRSDVFNIEYMNKMKARMMQKLSKM